MKKFLLSMLISTTLFSSTSYGGCWMQCVGVSIGGNCIGGKTKMCNWSGWKQDIDRVGKDINRFVNDIEREWKGLYRRNLPANIRNTINSTAVLFAGAYALGVAPALVGGSLAVVATRTALRAEQGKKVHTNSKPWIKDLEETGNALITTYEAGISLIYGDAKDLFRSEIDGRNLHSKFITCLSGSSSHSQAVLHCVVPLEEALFDIKKEVTLEVLSSEL